MSTSKRRRIISPCNESSQPPNEVVSGTGPVVAAAAADLELADPRMEEIPNLLFIQMQKDDENAVASAMESLTDLFRNDENRKNNIQEARSLGAHNLSIVAMRKWQLNIEVQAHGCFCLWGMSHKSLEATISIVKSGGVEAIIDAMKISPENESIQQNAGVALANIFLKYDNNAVVEAAMVRFVNDLDGILPVVKSMKRFPDHIAISKAGCYLFNSLATRKELHKAMMKAGVISTVGMAMEKHDDDEKLQHFARECLQRLVSPN